MIFLSILSAILYLSCASAQIGTCKDAEQDACVSSCASKGGANYCLTSPPSCVCKHDSLLTSFPCIRCNCSTDLCQNKVSSESTIASSLKTSFMCHCFEEKQEVLVLRVTNAKKTEHVKKMNDLFTNLKSQDTFKNSGAQIDELMKKYGVWK